MTFVTAHSIHHPPRGNAAQYARAYQMPTIQRVQLSSRDCSLAFKDVHVIEKPADHRQQPFGACRQLRMIGAGEHGELCMRKEPEHLHGMFGGG